MQMGRLAFRRDDVIRRTRTSAEAAGTELATAPRGHRWIASPPPSNLSVSVSSRRFVVGRGLPGFD